MTNRIVTESDDQRGSATVEFAITLPVVLTVLILGMAALTAVAAHVRLQSAANGAARAAGRADSEAVARILATASGSDVRTEREDGIVCLTCRRSMALGSLRVPISAVACAPDRGA